MGAQEGILQFCYSETFALRPESKIAAGRTFGKGGNGNRGEVERRVFHIWIEISSYKAKLRQGWHLLALKPSQTQISLGLALRAGDFSVERPGQVSVRPWHTQHHDSWMLQRHWPVLSFAALRSQKDCSSSHGLPSPIT